MTQRDLNRLQEWALQPWADHTVCRETESGQIVLEEYPTETIARAHVADAEREAGMLRVPCRHKLVADYADPSVRPEKPDRLRHPHIRKVVTDLQEYLERVIDAPPGLYLPEAVADANHDIVYIRRLVL